MIARHFMYKQVYLHHIRRVYDLHLKDFLKQWLSGGQFSIDIEKHLQMSDVEVGHAIRLDYQQPESPRHILARRLQCRDHFRRFYEVAPGDFDGGRLKPGETIFLAAVGEFGEEKLRYDYIPAKVSAPIFPVRVFDGRIESSLQRSAVLANMPPIAVDNVYCDKSIQAEAIKWREKNKGTLLNL